MKHWDDVIQQSGNARAKNIYRLDENKLQQVMTAVNSTPRRHLLVAQQYPLGDPYMGIYFTHREAECLYYLLCGLTIACTAEQLGLSPRTVEFYVKNMKEKMSVKTKSELMERLHEVSFLRVLQARLCDDMANLVF